MRAALLPAPLRSACMVLALATPSLPQAADPAAATAGPPAARLPLRRDEPALADVTPWLTGTALLGLAAVGGALVLVRRGRWPLVRGRAGLGPPARAIVRLASQPLTAQASVHAIRWNGEELLVACSGQAVTLLARKPADAGEDA